MREGTLVYMQCMTLLTQPTLRAGDPEAQSIACANTISGARRRTGF